MVKLAYSIDEIPAVASIGRTKVFAEIGSGRLKARKIGRRTVVLADDLAEYLAALPSVGV
jgi:hypothetical protein